MVSKQKTYRTTVTCTSIVGLIGCMRKDDFYRLENQPQAWKAITANANQKELAITKHVDLKKDVEIVL